MLHEEKQFLLHTLPVRIAFKLMLQTLHFVAVTIIVLDSGTGSSYFYRGSGIPHPDHLIFIADPGTRIRILLFYRGSGIRLFLLRIQRDSDIFIIALSKL
jgi:hypothetical protein